MASASSPLARLQTSLELLNQGAAGQGSSALLETLSVPVALIAAPGSLPAFYALPLAQQAELLLLFRAAPHRFSHSSVASLLRPAQTDSLPETHIGSKLLQLLAHGLVAGSELGQSWDVAPPVLPCPDFLFTNKPAFPWAPALVEPGTAVQQSPAGLAMAGSKTEGAPVTGRQSAVDAPAGGGGKKRPGRVPAPATAAEPEVAPKRQRTRDAVDLPEEEEGGLDGEGQGQAGQPGHGSAALVRQTAARASELVQPVAKSGPANVPADGGETSEGGTSAVMAAAAALRRALAMAAAAAPGGASLDVEGRQALSSVLSTAGAVGTTASTAGATALLAQAGLTDDLPHEVLLLVVMEAVGPSTTFARSSLVAEALLLRALRGLDSAPSRALAAALEHVASHNPQALLRSCLQPLLAAPGLNQHQAELLTRLAKGSLPPSLLPELLIAACGGSGSNAMPHTGGPHAEPAVPAGASWNEQSVGLLQTVLALKPDLHQASLQCLALALQGAAAVEQLRGSPKFAKLMMSAVKQYGSGLRDHKAALQGAAASTTSFMTKSLVAAVAKL